MFTEGQCFTLFENIFHKYIETTFTSNTKRKHYTYAIFCNKQGHMKQVMKRTKVDQNASMSERNQHEKSQECWYFFSYGVKWILILLMTEYYSSPLKYHSFICRFSSKYTKKLKKKNRNVFTVFEIRIIYFYFVYIRKRGFVLLYVFGPFKKVKRSVNSRFQ